MIDHWAAPTAPSQEAEARYARAVRLGLTEAEANTAEQAAEQAANAAMDDRLETARAQGASDARRWDAIYRAAVCAAARAIQARDWTAKRAALAVAEQADVGRQALLGAIFGPAKEIPAQYAPMETAGREISREQSSAARKVIAADREVMRSNQRNNRNRRST